MTVGERKKLKQRIKYLEAQFQSSKELYDTQTKELVSAKAEILELQEKIIRLEKYELKRIDDMSDLKQTVDYLQDANENLTREVSQLRESNQQLRQDRDLLW